MALTSVLWSNRALAQAAQRGCGVSSWEISKSRLDVGLGSLLWVSLLEQGLGLVGSRGPCPPQPLCDPVITPVKS